MPTQLITPTLSIRPGLVQISLSTAQCEKLSHACDVASQNNGDEQLLEYMWLFMALAQASSDEAK